MLDDTSTSNVSARLETALTGALEWLKEVELGKDPQVLETAGFILNKLNPGKGDEYLNKRAARITKEGDAWSRANPTEFIEACQLSPITALREVPNQWMNLDPKSFQNACRTDPIIAMKYASEQWEKLDPQGLLYFVKQKAETSLTLCAESYARVDPEGFIQKCLENKPAALGGAWEHWMKVDPQSLWDTCAGYVTQVFQNGELARAWSEADPERYHQRVNDYIGTFAHVDSKSMELLKETHPDKMCEILKGEKDSAAILLRWPKTLLEYNMEEFLNQAWVLGTTILEILPQFSEEERLKIQEGIRPRAEAEKTDGKLPITHVYQRLLRAFESYQTKDMAPYLAEMITESVSRYSEGGKDSFGRTLRDGDAGSREAVVWAVQRAVELGQVEDATKALLVPSVNYGERSLTCLRMREIQEACPNINSELFKTSLRAVEQMLETYPGSADAFDLLKLLTEGVTLAKDNTQTWLEHIAAGRAEIDEATELLLNLTLNEEEKQELVKRVLDSPGQSLANTSWAAGQAGNLPGIGKLKLRRRAPAVESPGIL